MKLRLITSINSFFHDMKKGYYNHDEYLEGRSKILNVNSFAELSSSNKQYIYGYMDALYNEIWNNYIIWKHYHPDKGLIESEQVPSTDWNKIESKKSGYVWKDNDKPFYMMAKKEKT